MRGPEITLYRWIISGVLFAVLLSSCVVCAAPIRNTEQSSTNPEIAPKALYAIKDFPGIPPEYTAVFSVDVRTEIGNALGDKTRLSKMDTCSPIKEDCITLSDTTRDDYREPGMKLPNYTYQLVVRCSNGNHEHHEIVSATRDPETRAARVSEFVGFFIKSHEKIHNKSK